VSVPRQFRDGAGVAWRVEVRFPPPGPVHGQAGAPSLRITSERGEARRLFAPAPPWTSVSRLSDAELRELLLRAEPA